MISGLCDMGKIKDKTVKEWFEELPPEIRTRAIKNCSYLDWENVECKSMYTAVAGAFIWSKTPEGKSFWQEWANYKPEEYTSGDV